MALLAIGDLVLPLRAGGSRGCTAHEHEFIDTRDRSAQEAEAILPAIDIQHGEGGSVDGEDVSHEAVVREVAEIELAPPVRMQFASAVVEVLVLRDAVIETAIVERHGYVVINVEGLPCRISRIDPLASGKPQTAPLGLVTRVQDWIIDGIETNHTFVDIGSGVVHAVVVEPQERLFFRIVVAGSVVEVEIVYPLPRYVSALVVSEVMRLAIAFRRRMTVVQVGEKRPVRRAEVLAIATQGVEVQIVLKTYNVGLPVHGIDSGTGESPVESVDGAYGQSLRFGDYGWRDHRQAAAGDGLHL